MKRLTKSFLFFQRLMHAAMEPLETSALLTILSLFLSEMFTDSGI